MRSTRNRRARRLDVVAGKRGGYLVDDDNLMSPPPPPAAPPTSGIRCRRCGQPLLDPAGRDKTRLAQVCAKCLLPSETPEDRAAREAGWVDSAAGLQGHLARHWTPPWALPAVDVDADQRLADMTIRHRPRHPEPHRAAPGRPARLPMQRQLMPALGWTAPTPT